MNTLQRDGISASVAIILTVGVALVVGCVTGRPVETRPQKVRVACIGDSITWGYAMTNRVEECYPSQLQRLLGDGYDVRNFGDPGSGVYSRPKRGPSGWQPHPWRSGGQARAAYGFRPDIVVCNLGINDAEIFMNEFVHGEDGRTDTERGLFCRDYVDLLNAFGTDGKPPRIILWRRLGPTGKRHQLKGKPFAFVMEADLERVAATVGAETIDMYSPLVAYAETDDFAADGIHPEGGAQRVIAEIIARQILRQ